MNFLVVGCGRVGAELAYRLFKSGHQVVVVDSDRSAFNRLQPDFRGRTLEGEGLAENVLDRAGIKDADGLAAVTNSDTIAPQWRIPPRIFKVPIVVSQLRPALRSVIEARLADGKLGFLGRPARGGTATNSAQNRLLSRRREVGVYEIMVPDHWKDHDQRSPGNAPQYYPLARAGTSFFRRGVDPEPGDVLNLGHFRRHRPVTTMLEQKAKA
jgi:trk system potassium uptake protein TrkA